MAEQRCLFCGGDASAPDHARRCDGRQGRLEAAAPARGKGARYRRAHLAVYQATSRQALEDVQVYLPGVDALIVCCIAAGGATGAEVEVRTGLKHQTVSAQIRHMVEAGLLEDSGARRPNEDGRACIVWVIAPPPTMRQAS